MQEEVAVINPMWVGGPRLQWMEVEISAGKEKKVLTHELESGSGVTVYASDNAGVTPSKSTQTRGREQLSVGATATTEQNPTLL